MRPISYISTENMEEQTGRILILVSRKPQESTLFLAKAVSCYCAAFGGGKGEAIIEKDGAGRPFVANLPLSVSLTHTDGMTLAAVSAGAVGVDAERKRELPFAALSARFFGERITEKEAFFARWTAGEAYKKATGLHLPAALRAVTPQETRAVCIDARCAVALSGSGRIYFMIDE